MLRVRGLCKRFGGLQALDGVDLDVWAGRVHALIGPNGAGKSTLINVVCGFVSADAGSVELQGQSVGALLPEARARRGLIRTFQDVRGFPELSVLDNAMAGAHIHMPAGLFAPLLAPRGVASAVSSSRAELQAVVDQVGLAEDSDVPLAALPFGKQRLLGVVRAMAARPRSVLLDEPGAGLGRDEARRVIHAVRALRNSGVAVLLVEHHMSVVEAVADVVTVLDFGRVIAHGTWAEVRRDPRVREAYLGRVDGGA